MASIFTKIIQGEIPCEKIIETDSEIAFLDIMPCAAGHTLVIPKLEVERLEDLPAEQALSLMRTMQQVAKAVSTAFDGIDYNLILNNGFNAGQEIAHVHFHVLPRAKGSPRPFREHVQYAEGEMQEVDRKSTRLNSSHALISYAVFCLKKKKKKTNKHKKTKKKNTLI